MLVKQAKGLTDAYSLQSTEKEGLEKELAKYKKMSMERRASDSGSSDAAAPSAGKEEELQACAAL